MKQLIALFILLTMASIAYPQDDNLRFKLDSIVKEADVLYSYEKAAWVATDLFMANRKLKKDYGGYIVYHSNDTVFAVFLNKNQDGKKAKYYFTDLGQGNPFRTEIEDSPLTANEQELLVIKIKIIGQLSGSKYDVSIPPGFNPNFVLIRDNANYKLYILMGTSQSGIIPFGNDYLFRADPVGKITYWKKFHSRLIATPSKAPNGEKVISCMHSHLETTPYITATDICTFRLYSALAGMEYFSVLCTATDKTYEYSIKTNKIEIENR